VSAYNVNNIIPITTTISPAGLSFANFAKAFMFAPESELPVGFETDTIRTYTRLSDVAVDFADTTETYKALSKWLGGTPAQSSVTVYGVDALDATITATLNKARDLAGWWYWSFFTADVYADVTTDVPAIAAWHDANDAFFINCQTGTSVTAIRNPSVSDDIASVLTQTGYRHTMTFAHSTDPYAGIALAKWYAAVNYSANNSTITGFGKKLSGVAAETLTGTEYSTMELDTKIAAFYTVVDLQGSTDNGRVINAKTHSTFGEYGDDVVNLDAFVNALKVSLYNTIVNQTKKLQQTPRGQAVINATARTVCQQYVSNGYLGERNYIDPDDGVEKYTPGYEILTKPEDILNLSDSDRDARKAAALKIRIFRAGAIEQAPVDIEVY
jgi:hypothetical protein